jgi:hypothetical protein
MQMIGYGHIALRQFPKKETHVLGAEIRTSMLRVHRLIITVSKRFHKKTTLTELDIEVTVLQRLVRLAKELMYIDIKKYQIWSAFIVEIGKMLGGWIKSAGARG